MDDDLIAQIRRSNLEAERTVGAILLIDLAVGVLFLLTTNNKSLPSLAMPRELFGGLMVGTSAAALGAIAARGELFIRAAVLAVAAVWVSFVVVYGYHRTLERASFITLIVAIVLIGHFRAVIGINQVSRRAKEGTPAQ